MGYKQSFKGHQAKWKSCTRCSLREHRNTVVLARGRERGKLKLPIDMLYVGEAPGATEDVLGSPFTGPAGQLLDEVIEYAEQLTGIQPVIAFTNLVACIPKEDGIKIHEPNRECIEACRPRLLEFITLSRPRVIILVGKLAAKWFPGINSNGVCSINKRKMMTHEIVHPAAILKAKDPAQRSLAIQRTAVIIEEVLESL